jgi:lipopolysaccharide/colanic/teichoic acid biosynthesis glycosyltransferase/SAM-dependent methyltransferase
VFDLVVSALVTIAISPMMGLIALLIRADGHGPMLYRGARVGRRGRLFRMYKFRTMVPNAESIGGSSTPADDARITRIGGILRRYKLDELPQLFNVLKGDMSLVGPRPQVADEVAGYSDEERELLEVRPGITDWASIEFSNEGEILQGRGDPDLAYAELIRPKKMALGLRYVRAATLNDDVQILWQTLTLPFRRSPGKSQKAFTQVTETWGLPASPEQLAMAYFRYHLAGEMSAGKRLLEVGCGSGMGLPYLRDRAKEVVGCDVSGQLLGEARRHIEGVELVQTSGNTLPFTDGRFDVVVLLEMIYYVDDQDALLRECKRVLAPRGTTMICLPNRDRPAFNPSPYSVRYPNVPELRELLIRNGFEPTIFGGFAVAPSTFRDRMLDALRSVAVTLHLVPRTIRGKALIKRILYGSLPRLGEIYEGMADFEEPMALASAEPTSEFKNLYAIGRSPIRDSGSSIQANG